MKDSKVTRNKSSEEISRRQFIQIAATALEALRSAALLPAVHP